jgi:hypothetical protein
MSGILHALQSLQRDQRDFQVSVNTRLSAIELHVASRCHDDIAGDAPVLPHRAQAADVAQIQI